MFGLSPEHWSFVHTTAVEPLVAQGAHVFAFGSRARGDHQKFSDLDLCFRSAHEIDDTLIPVIRAALEDSALPIKVDLVNWDDLPESFKSNITHDMVEIL